jgi:hypothetical protein
MREGYGFVSTEGVWGRVRLHKIEKSIGAKKRRPQTHRTDFTKESEIMTALTKNVSPSFSKMYGTMEGRIAFQQEAKRRELRKRQHLACAIAEEGRRRASTEEERRYAKRPRTEARVHMKKAPTEKEKTHTTEYPKEEEKEYATARAKMEKELANVKKAEEALAKEEEKERAKEKEKALAIMSMRKKRAEDNRILSLSDDDMMTAVLQSLGHPRTIGADLLSVYTLWLFTATKSHRNGRPINRLALMKAFAVEYFSLARRGDNPPPSLIERD